MKYARKCLEIWVIISEHNVRQLHLATPGKEFSVSNNSLILGNSWTGGKPRRNEKLQQKDKKRRKMKGEKPEAIDHFLVQEKLIPLRMPEQKLS